MYVQIYLNQKVFFTDLFLEEVIYSFLIGLISLISLIGLSSQQKHILKSL